MKSKVKTVERKPKEFILIKVTPEEAARLREQLDSSRCEARLLWSQVQDMSNLDDHLASSLREIERKATS